MLTHRGSNLARGSFHNRHHTHLGQYALLRRANEPRKAYQPTAILASRALSYTRRPAASTLALTAAETKAAAAARRERRERRERRRRRRCRRRPAAVPATHERGRLPSAVDAAAHACARPLQAAPRLASSLLPRRAHRQSPSSASAVNRSIGIQSVAQLLAVPCGGCVRVVQLGRAVALYAGSQLLWLSPLNLNWLWTCPHLCVPGSRPTVSFYTPDSALGGVLDAYMGWENYHVEHHDFPDIPMYHLPKLRKLAPRRTKLRCAVLSVETWRGRWAEYVYACQTQRSAVTSVSPFDR